jgi:hypothetical protein
LGQMASFASAEAHARRGAVISTKDVDRFRQY